jgi:DNA-binding NtrC family response regulator
VKEAITQNAYACLYKPFDNQKLIAIIEGILAAKAKDEIQQMGGD